LRRGCRARLLRRARPPARPERGRGPQRPAHGPPARPRPAPTKAPGHFVAGGGRGAGAPAPPGAMSRDPLDRVKAFFGEEDPPASRMGRYETGRELAGGGMAVVYEALDPDLKRPVALKVLKVGSLERLGGEAQAAARLRHPNVIAIHEVGPDYIAMDLL